MVFFPFIYVRMLHRLILGILEDKNMTADFYEEKQSNNFLTKKSQFGIFQKLQPIYKIVLTYNYGYLLKYWGQRLERWLRNIQQQDGSKIEFFSDFGQVSRDRTQILNFATIFMHYVMYHSHKKSKIIYRISREKVRLV